ncbi:UvrB/UvrC motif-containing protein [Clostridium sp.]|uniref:UvrB/UvrC motif-containing protein n=1 Tax=Clostridium sp. TaxID=1506 RepID=UPI002FCB4983
MDLKEKVKNLPLCPGVYLMKDSQEEVIYVGKSKSLKNRVGSYFQNFKNRSPKVEKLVMNLKNFDYILTDTEFEAFMLECKLIKEIKPIYNRLMKNPQSYVYIQINMDEVYPSIKVTNNINENSGNVHFGPYTRKSTAERAVEGIKDYCKINCSNPSKKNSACINYSLDLCLGMCLGNSATVEYQNIINKIISLLNGNDNRLLKEMEDMMITASEKFDFEVAAKYRDYIDGINVLINKEKVIGFTVENQNIAMIEYLNESTIKFFIIKGNKVLFSEKYHIANVNMEEINQIIKANILFYFNDDSLNDTIEISKNEIDEAHIIYSYLKSNNCRYITFSSKWFADENNMEIDKALKELLHG